MSSFIGPYIKYANYKILYRPGIKTVCRCNFCNKFFSIIVFKNSKPKCSHCEKELWGEQI